MTTLIAVPMLGRAHHVAPLVESIEASTPEPHRIVFVTTVGDDAVNDAVDATGCERITMPPIQVGDYARKINQVATLRPFDYLFTGASDLRFHPGWLTAAIAKMVPGIGVVGTQDQCNARVIAGRHATHFLVAAWWIDLGTIDEPGKVFHEGYPHECVDDELVATARHRSAWAFANDSVVEHLHPMVGKAPTDDMYDLAPVRMRRGRHLFRQRERLWTT